MKFVIYLPEAFFLRFYSVVQECYLIEKTPQENNRINGCSFRFVVYAGWNWTKGTQELIRLDELRRGGFVEAIVEGQGESLEKAKEDAKKNALEFVNGTMIEINILL
ncbi:MAG: hypothetical protein LBT05_11955 [Planctomycetaceae bacterium]|nr:hypothetical protein [Planctomycetaceae bacterium]